MKPGVAQRLRIALGLLLGVAIGAACRVFHIPSPAPPVLTGALLVVSMTLGYLAAGRFSRRNAFNEGNCGGPDGGVRDGLP